MEAELVPHYDGQGNLDIIVDNQVVFSSLQLERFPEDGEIVGLLKQFTDETGK